MITADTLAALDGIVHMFFTRQGGVSTGIYGSLNCGPGSNDRREDVLNNRARAMAALQLDPAALVTVHQIHSPTVVRVDKVWTVGEQPKADGMVTTVPGIALGVLAADCAPVLFADAEAGVIGAAHSGWKGALGGICDAVVDLMTEEGARADRIVAAVGPCIAQPSYEVGAEFRTAFLEAGSANSRFFADGTASDKYQFDLAGYLFARLSGLGLKSVEVMGLDTYQDPDRFFSYRRATHKGEPDYGRMLSAIALT